MGNTEFIFECEFQCLQEQEFYFKLESQGRQKNAC